jgi:hypothetical protein
VFEYIFQVTIAQIIDSNQSICSSISFYKTQTIDVTDIIYITLIFYTLFSDLGQLVNNVIFISNYNQNKDNEPRPHSLVDSTPVIHDEGFALASPSRSGFAVVVAIR